SDVWEACKNNFFSIVKAIPVVHRYITEELKKTQEDVDSYYESASKVDAIASPITALPAKSMSKEDVLKTTADLLGITDFNWQNGSISGGVFSGNDPHYNSLLTQIYGMTAWTNPLHADVFPGTRKMEAEIVRMTIGMFHGDEHCAGSIQTGGSESILMVMKAMRDWGINQKGISRPEVIGCVSAHAAFDKAAHFLGLRFKKVPYDTNTWGLDIKAMRRAITKSTVLLIGSAPDFPHGIIDDFEAIGALGERYGIPVHVDCCMGGFLLPFMEAAGYKLPPFDFRVKGVTSISADPHKYGNVPKGSSVVMYRNKEYIHHQYFVTPNWPGGIYASPNIPGSRAGGLISQCWAAMLSHGFQGYTNITKSILKQARKLKEKWSEIPGLFVYGDPLASIVCVGSNEINIMTVADILTKNGWHLGVMQYPPGMHLCLTSLHVIDNNLVDNLARDTRKAVEEVRNNPNISSGGIGKIYGAASQIPDRSMVALAGKMFLESYYDTNQSEQHKAFDSQK
ncbi:unnamed protein product, partial [Meganyctiphanes norvegica]